MNILILKLGATGDVVRSTPLLHLFSDLVTWVTEAKNTVLLHNLERPVRCFAWEDRQQANDREYDLVLNLEDTNEVAHFVTFLHYKQLFGAYLSANGRLQYTSDSSEWFDLSLISRHGTTRADQLKLENRRSYQDLVMNGLGATFTGQPYLLPAPAATALSGDVAVAPEAGPVWPMKNWAFYDTLIAQLEESGLIVNRLPKRATLLEHLGDVCNHRCVLGGDSLPMHLALGSGIRCVSLFNCTSPWEIYGYGRQQQIVSPLLAEFFYRRTFDPRATTAISVEEVHSAVLNQLNAEVVQVA